MSTQQAFPKLDTPFVDLQTGLLGIPWYQLLISLWNRTGGSAGGGTIQTGTILPFAGSVIPDGYLLCDGTNVSISSFEDLFGVIGFDWGPGDGHTTFGLPDLTDRTLIGAGGTIALGDVGGADSVTLTVEQLPAHSHTVSDPGHTHVQNAHSHVQRVFNNNTAGAVGSQGSDTANATSVGTTDTTTAINQDALTGITLDNTGSGDSIDILPPYAGVYYMIKT